MFAIPLPHRRRTSAPPASPRRRAAAPIMPEIYAYYRRTSDDTIWQVRNVHPRDLQVRLERPGQPAIFPFLGDLSRDYLEIGL